MCHSQSSPPGWGLMWRWKSLSRCVAQLHNSLRETVRLDTFPRKLDFSPQLPFTRGSSVWLYVFSWCWCWGPLAKCLSINSIITESIFLYCWLGSNKISKNTENRYRKHIMIHIHIVIYSRSYLYTKWHVFPVPEAPHSWHPSHPRCWAE